MTSIPGEHELWHFVRTWNLEPDGTPIVTHSSRLLAARRDDRPVMLKLTNVPEEVMGGAVLQWWNGDGAVRVLERSDNALLMERAIGPGSLYRQSLAGDDETTVAILCDIIERLHLPRTAPPPPTIPLRAWFVELLEAQPSEPEVVCGQNLARSLIDRQQDVVILHGDVHHQNVLDSGDGRWLAIDPKGLLGDRAFDHVNIFRNPTAGVAADPTRFAQRLDQITHRAQLDRKRLLEWTAAFCALSYCWGSDPQEMSPDTDWDILCRSLEHLQKIAI
ncbi:MAG: hypothetical protein M9947_15420 [Thermomicrobiales bacterium]|nr:hypothetical protein [Thermomicrobiales bacterium]